MRTIFIRLMHECKRYDGSGGISCLHGVQAHTQLTKFSICCSSASSAMLLLVYRATLNA